MVKFTGELNIEKKDLSVPFYLERISLLFMKGDENYFSLDIVGKKIKSIGIYKRSEMFVINNTLKSFLNQNKSLLVEYDVFKKLNKINLGSER